MPGLTARHWSRHDTVHSAGTCIPSDMDTMQAPSLWQTTWAWCAYLAWRGQMLCHLSRCTALLAAAAFPSHLLRSWRRLLDKHYGLLEERDGLDLGVVSLLENELLGNVKAKVGRVEAVDISPFHILQDVHTSRLEHLVEQHLWR